MMNKLLLLIFTGINFCILSCKQHCKRETFTLKAVSCNEPGNPCTMVQPGSGHMGQYMVFSEKFVNDATGEIAGIDDGYCMLTDTMPMRYLCTKTATLSNGTLCYGGIYVPGDSVSIFSIWNGTGSYKDAGGEVRVYHTPDSVRLVFEVR